MNREYENHGTFLILSVSKDLLSVEITLFISGNAMGRMGASDQAMELTGLRFGPVKCKWALKKDGDVNQSLSQITN